MEALKKIFALLLISAGAIVCEHLLVFCYRIWWLRDLPLDGKFFLDGLGRRLEDAPAWARIPFGRGGYWIGSGQWMVDSSKVLVGVLLAYGLVRVGWAILDKCFLGGTGDKKRDESRAT
jgi:hypothetical protein